MYESGPDPYCYPGTGVLENRLDLRDQWQLDAFEALITAQRSEEPLPRGRLGYPHYRAIYRHLFQDVLRGPANSAPFASLKAAACFAIRNTSTAR